MVGERKSVELVGSEEGGKLMYQPKMGFIVLTARIIYFCFR